MAVAVAIEAERLALQGVLGHVEVDRAIAIANGLDRPLERRQGGAGVAARAACEQTHRLVGDRRWIRDPALRIGERPLEHGARLTGVSGWSSRAGSGSRVPS